MIVVVNYGLGNLRSICSALEKLNIRYICSSDKKIIKNADSLILPGVGSFSDGIKNIQNMGLKEILDYLVLDKKVPILGICLGFQLMSNIGYENGKNLGLRWLDAEVIKFKDLPNNCRIPHVGWNDCFTTNNLGLFQDIPDKSLFYFTHSYHMVCNEDNLVTSKTNHGKDFVSSIQKGNIYGTQFHPEKSQKYGLEIINNFYNLTT